MSLNGFLNEINELKQDVKEAVSEGVAPVVTKEGFDSMEKWLETLMEIILKVL